MNESRKGRRRKFRWGRFVLLLLVLILVIGGAVSYFQYKKGLSEASEGKFEDDHKNVDQFKGDLPEDGRINVLLLGSDSRGEAHSRTDSILIGQYDQNSHQPKLVSIMRDTYVNVPGHGMQKINSAYAFGGPELLRETIEKNFGIDINYYAVVDFQGFSKIADTVAPKGITVNISEKLSDDMKMNLEPGEHTLHGKDLLSYVRFRHDEQSDFGRVARQQEVLSKLKEEATNIKNVFKLPKIVGLLDPYIDTNVNTKSKFIVGKDFITGKAHKVESLRIPINGSFENERHNVGDVLSIDLEKNKEALREFLSAK